MIALVCFVLLATTCAGQNENDSFYSNENDFFYGYNPELWPKLPKDALQEYLTLKPEDADRVQMFSFPRAFQCLDKNADNWTTDVKICLAEIWNNGDIQFIESGPRGERLAGPGDIPPNYWLCALHELVAKCFTRNRVYMRCGSIAIDFAETLLLTPSQKPAQVQESCNSQPEAEKRRIRAALGFGQYRSMLVPVRRRFVTETPQKIQRCLKLNEEHIRVLTYERCGHNDNATTSKGPHYRMCMSFGQLEQCHFAIVEKNCGTEGVQSELDISMSQMPLFFWMSCTMSPAFEYTESPPGVKFLD